MVSRYYSTVASSTGTGTGYTASTASCGVGLTTVESLDMSGSYSAIWEYYLVSGSNIRGGRLQASFEPSSPSASYHDVGPMDIGTFPTSSVYVSASGSYLNLVVSSSVAGVSATANRLKF